MVSQVKVMKEEEQVWPPKKMTQTQIQESISMGFGFFICEKETYYIALSSSYKVKCDLRLKAFLRVEVKP